MQCHSLEQVLIDFFCNRFFFQRILPFYRLKMWKGKWCFSFYVIYLEAVVQRCSVKKVFLAISQNSQENTCARVSSLKKRLRHRCFPVNFAKFLGTRFLQNTSGRLLLFIITSEFLFRPEIVNSPSHTWLIILIRFIALKIIGWIDVWKLKENVMNQ